MSRKAAPWTSCSWDYRSTLTLKQMTEFLHDVADARKKINALMKSAEWDAPTIQSKATVKDLKVTSNGSISGWRVTCAASEKASRCWLEFSRSGAVPTRTEGHEP